MLGTLFTQASTVHVPEAQEIARNFFYQLSPQSSAGSGIAANPSLAYTAVDESGAPDFYIFNRNSESGYVIVAGDDAAVPIIGYTEEGSFKLTEVSTSMLWWLEECQHEIQYIKQNPEQARSAQSVSKAVRPLVTTMWAQSSPYNAKCPTYIMGYTAYRCATGCVATAMAQIMKYHEWPEQGTGEHTYECNVNGSTKVTTLSADFSSSVYDWDNMTDIYDTNSTTVQKNAVSLLMKDVGYSVDMGYGSSSGAFSPAVVNALTTYFGYDNSVRLCSRENYSIETWEQMIRNELDNNRPVYYSGVSSTGGHAFVCDGYDHEGYFHFNWGWGGKGNGYFLLSMLNPNNRELGTVGTGYNSLQEIIINIMPDQGGVASAPVTGASCTIVPVSTSVNLGEAATFNVTQACMTGEKDWTTLYWSIVATSTDINTNNIVDGYTSLFDATEIKLGGGYTLSGLTYTPSTSLANGKYYIRLAYAKDDDNKGLFKGTSPTNYVIDMEVKDGKAYFTTHYEQTNVSMANLTMTPAFKGQKMQVSARITNNDTKDFYDNVYVALMNNGRVEQMSDAMLVALAPGESAQISTVITANVNAGNYTLAMLDNSKEEKAEAPVTVVDGGGTPSLQVGENITPALEEMPANDVKASALITNTGGTYAGQLEMIVYNSSKKTILTTIKSDLVTIAKDESVRVEFNGEFGGLVGETYYIALRNPSVTNTTSAWSTLVPFTVCVEPEVVEPPANPCDVNLDGEVDISDVNTVLKCLMGGGTPEENVRADVNGDGDIDIADINRILMYITSQ